MQAFKTALRPSLRFSAARLIASPSASSLFFAATRHLSSDIKAKIDGAVTANPLVLFMKGTPDLPQCGFSRAVCQILETQGVPLEKMKTFNILEDQELRDSIKEYSSWPTIPQLYLKGEFIGGCDIVLQLHQSGELEKLLAEAGVVDATEIASAPTVE